jgi:hypothetical protein
MGSEEVSVSAIFIFIDQPESIQFIRSPLGYCLKPLSGHVPGVCSESIAVLRKTYGYVESVAAVDTIKIHIPLV